MRIYVYGKEILKPCAITLKVNVEIHWLDYSFSRYLNSAMINSLSAKAHIRWGIKKNTQTCEIVFQAHISKLCNILLTF